MKFISKKNFIPLALAGAMALGSAALCAGIPARTASAAEDMQAVYTHTAPQENGIMPLSICSQKIIKPIEPLNGKEHYFMVTYDIRQVDAHADWVYGYNGASDRSPSAYFHVTEGQTTKYCMMADRFDKTPHPTFFVLRTYCSQCNVTSEGINVFQKGNKVTPLYMPLASKTSGTIPTAYKQGENQWDHGGNTGDTIIFEFAYNGEKRLGVVTVPWIGYSKEFKMSFSDNTFYVRTGPDTLSIKAEKAAYCNNYNTMFAYNLEKNL